MGVFEQSRIAIHASFVALESPKCFQFATISFSFPSSHATSVCPPVLHDPSLSPTLSTPSSPTAAGFLPPSVASKRRQALSTQRKSRPTLASFLAIFSLVAWSVLPSAPTPPVACSSASSSHSSSSPSIDPSALVSDVRGRLAGGGAVDEKADWAETDCMIGAGVDVGAARFRVEGPAVAEMDASVGAISIFSLNGRDVRFGILNR